MNNKSILVNRHSSRAFQNKPVEIDVLKDIVKEASLAPSWENTQPWKVYLATGKSVKNIRASHIQSVNDKEKSWTEVVPPQSWSTYTQHNIDEWLNDIKSFFSEAGMNDFFKSNALLFNAPAIAYITIPKDSSHYSAYDAGALGYGLLLSAFEHGLSAVPAYELIRYPKEIRSQFNIPEDESIMMGVAIGYPEETEINTLKTKRNDLDTILTIAE